MELRTQVKIESFENKINHSSVALSMGSCFAGNIADKMRQAKFTVLDNPFGVLFNPVSIADSLKILNQRRNFEHEDLVDHDGLWSNFAFHGSFNSGDASLSLEKMNKTVKESSKVLTDADYVIITFGTAWVYELLSSGQVVANCHKFPSSMFRRRRLTVGQIVEMFDGLFEDILKNKQVIFTVSPVRHIKDGFAENTLSKAILIEAVHELLHKHPNTVYFPAFEIMNDELRDYRFYAEDMVHPSALAIEYIWQRFSDAAFSTETQEAVAEIEKLIAAVQHRPFNPENASHREFMTSMLKRTHILVKRYPKIDFTEELSFFSTSE